MIVTVCIVLKYKFMLLTRQGNFDKLRKDVESTNRHEKGYEKLCNTNEVNNGHIVMKIYKE